MVCDLREMVSRFPTNSCMPEPVKEANERDVFDSESEEQYKYYTDITGIGGRALAPNAKLPLVMDVLREVCDTRLRITSTNCRKTLKFVSPFFACFPVLMCACAQYSERQRQLCVKYLCEVPNLTLSGCRPIYSI